MLGRNFKILILGLALSGCAHTAPSGIKLQTVEVPKIVVQKCVKKEDIPVEPEPLANTEMPSDKDDQIRVLLSKVADWVKYGNYAETVFDSCVSD